MPNSQPLVSIAVPSYNHARYVADCIRSIIDQTYSNVELIVIDDGSTDSSPEIIKALEHQCAGRFRRFEFRARPNRGLTATLNEAIEWSQGEFFSAIASDDELLPHKTSALIDAFSDDKQVAGTFGGICLIDESGRALHELCPPQSAYSFGQIITRTAAIYAPAQLLRLSCLREAGPLPEGLYIEDWYLWLQLTRNGGLLKTIPDVVARYRRHESNSSSNPNRMHAARMQILREYESHPLFKQGMAAAHILTAQDYLDTSTSESAIQLIRAIITSPRSAFSSHAMKVAIQLPLPRPVRQVLLSISSHRRRRRQ